MNRKFDDIETLLALQGDLCLVHQRGQEHLLTFVHVVDDGSRQLRLVNRQGSNRKPDWPVGQRLLDAIKPAKTNEFGAKWELAVK